jgi:hypothetical protein
MVAPLMACKCMFQESSLNKCQGDGSFVLCLADIPAACTLRDINLRRVIPLDGLRWFVFWRLALLGYMALWMDEGYVRLEGSLG